MPFERNPTFGKEGTCKVAAGLADGGSVVESRSLREAEAEDDDQYGRTGSEPVQRAPAVRSSIYQASSESCGQKVAKCVALL